MLRRVSLLASSLLRISLWRGPAVLLGASCSVLLVLLFRSAQPFRRVLSRSLNGGLSGLSSRLGAPGHFKGLFEEL